MTNRQDFRRFRDLTEEEIASIELDVFERICQNSGFGEQEIKTAKETRRRLKNRKSAKDCSARQRADLSRLQKENAELRARIQELEARQNLPSPGQCYLDYGPDDPNVAVMWWN